MPEYLAPGVYVEETSFRSKSIEGVSTTTTGFVGPTLYGPIEDEPEILTSLLDYERTYGGGARLRFADEGATLTNADDLGTSQLWSLATNHMWHAVRAFFDNGGSRLYVKRIYREIPIGAAPAAGDPDIRTVDDGRSGAKMQAALPNGAAIQVQARHPGSSGDRRVRVTLSLGQNVLSSEKAQDGTARTIIRARGLQDRDVVLLMQGGGSPQVANAHLFTLADGAAVWRFQGGDIAGGNGPGDGTALSDLDPAADELSIVTLALTDLPGSGSGSGLTWAGLPLDAAHKRGEAEDSVFGRFAVDPARKADRLELPLIVRTVNPTNQKAVEGADVLKALFDHADATPAVPPLSTTLRERLESRTTTADQRSFELSLTGGSDGRRPTAAEYEGEADPNKPFKFGLKAFEDLEDISIVAAPGATDSNNNASWGDQADTIIQSLIGHCERMRYRIAVLDAGDKQSISAVRAMRAKIDSKHAALYYPWVVVLDPITQRELPLPPSGFVTGIFARNDRMRAVYKAPANEVVTGALRFETMLNRSQQEVLNPEGINCFRFFEGRGNRLWGARTVSSDPEWKYVNLRRYFAYLERSIDVGTQWAVFEPNGELLWGNIRRTIEDFLLNEFQMGALLGDKPEKAFFVKCDRSTMTQNDLDNGRLVCLIGVAPLRPAEFVIFRIGQWTADRKV